MPRPKVTFDTEKRVRAWVRDRTSEPFWIEPTKGSTIGAPDVYVHDRGGVWLELKRGTCDDRRPLKWTPRPGQYLALRTLRDRGARAGFLVGFGTRLFVSSDPQLFRRGWAEIRSEELPEARDPEAWGRILEKVLSDCS